MKRISGSGNDWRTHVQGTLPTTVARAGQAWRGLIVGLALAPIACGSRSGTLETVQAAPPATGTATSTPPVPDAGPPRGWISAADSTISSPIKSDKDAFGGQCLSDLGCPFQPMPLPLCPKGTSAIPLSDAVAAAQLDAGATVVVSSATWSYLEKDYALKGCSGKCCIVRYGGIFLAEADALPGIKPYNPQYPEAFHWYGDNSASCFGIAVGDGQPVVVRGRLRPPFELQDPEFCTPGEPEEGGAR